MMKKLIELLLCILVPLVPFLYVLTGGDLF
jgi:hypothetical protein